MEEVWKTIPGYSGFESSTKGNIRKLDGTPISQVLTGIPQYYYVNIVNDAGERKLRRVHVMVALAHIENPNNLPFVDHIDREKFNNNIENLRWVDRSGNQRNQEGSVWIDGIHLQDFCLQYENPSAAYCYIQPKVGDLGIEAVLDMYHEFLERGYDRRKVEWKGEEVYFTDLCKQYGVDTVSVSTRLSRGLPIWNAVFNVPETQPRSIEVEGNEYVSHWFPSKKYLRDFLGIGEDALESLLSTQASLDLMLNYDPLDRYRTEVLGFYGTFQEVCTNFGFNTECIRERLRTGISLEEALSVPLKRIKWVHLNGKRMTTKSMYEYFNINAKEANNWKSKNGATIEDTLTHYGVDLSGISLTY